MDYKKYLEDSLKIELDNNLSKKESLAYLEKLKTHPEIIIPEDYVIKNLDDKAPGFIMEYAINKSGGDSSDIDMEEINTFIKRITNGYNLIKYIETLKKEL